MDIKSVKDWWKEVCTATGLTPDEAATLVQTVDDLIAEVERLTALCDGYRGEVEAAKEPPTCFDDWWGSTKYGLPHWEQPHIFMPLDIGRDSFAAGYRLGKKERQSDLTRAGAEGMEEAARIFERRIEELRAANPNNHPDEEEEKWIAETAAALRARATQGESDEG